MARSPKSMSRISNRLLGYQLQRMDETPHHSYSFEIELRNIIMSGDEEAAFLFLNTMDTESVGQMAFTNQKAEEYGAVLMVSFLARYAMEGGVPPMDAYGLNDLYLQQISIAKAQEDYADIIVDAVKTFCRYVRDAKVLSTDEYLVRRCKTYVRRNLRQDLSLRKISEDLRLNPAYLSHTFSVQSGMTLKQFILQEKVEAAKNMLRFSAYPLSEIAQYLGFSSQSYFGAVFLRYTTETPAQYRRSVQKEKD